MKSDLKELVSQLIKQGYSLDDVKSCWNSEDDEKIQKLNQTKLNDWKEKYRDLYLGKYILINKNSNLDIIPGFTKTIDVDDIIPLVGIKIVKVDRVSLQLVSFNDFKYNLLLSGHSVFFNILGNRAEIDGDPLECFETCVSYYSHQYSNSSESFALDDKGELVSPDKLIILSPELLSEILNYYEDSQKFALEFIKNKLS